MDNNKLSEKLRLTASWACVATAQQTLLEYLEQYMKDNDLSWKTLLQELKNNTEREQHFKPIAESAILLTCVNAIIIGSADNFRSLFDFYMAKPLPVYGFNDSILKAHRKNRLASQVYQYIYDQYFTDTLRDMLRTTSRTGNFMIDVIYNDKTRDFILKL